MRTPSPEPGTTVCDVLVVDGANVVGSRPDGWWRDREGAAARLHARLVAADLAPHVVLVLEGRARGGVAAGTSGRTSVVHASGSGDDTIVDEAEAAAGSSSVVVVTADRGLAERVRSVGARVVGPGHLLDLLPDRAGEGSG